MFKNKIAIGIFVLTLGIFGLASFKAEAATCTASAGNWNTIGTWDCGHVPLSADDVVIPDTASVTVDTTAVANSVVLQTTNSAVTLTISGSNSLSVGGSVTITAPSDIATSTIAIGAGTLTVGGNLAIASGGSSTEISQVTLSTGTLTVGNGITFTGTAASAQLTTTAGATINLTGTVSSGGTLSINAATQLNAIGTSAINGFYIWGKVRVMSGTLTLGAIFVASTGLQVDSGATFAAGANNFNSACTGTGLSGFTINGTLSGTGGFSLSGSGCTIDGTGTITQSGTLNIQAHKTIAATAVLTFPGTVNLQTPGITTNNGNITLGGNFTAPDGQSVWTQGPNSTLTITAFNPISSGLLNASAVGNTVIYNRPTAPQIIKAPFSGSYYNLYLQGGGKNISTGRIIDNDLIIASGVTVDIGGSSTAGFLDLGGSHKSAGVWGATGSGAANIDDIYFASTGTVTVAGKHSSGITTTGSGGGGSFTTTFQPIPTPTPVVTPPAPTPVTIAGCEGRNTGYSTATGASCVGNTIVATLLPLTMTESPDLGTVTLKWASKGQYVMNLQSWLNARMNAGLAVDGIFGRLTEAKVKAWQASVGLVVDGAIGPKSRAKIASM